MPLPRTGNRRNPAFALVTEIVKLAEARIGDDVIYSFIDNEHSNRRGANHLSERVGVWSIISAMLQHDQDLVSGVRSLTVASEPACQPILPRRRRQ
jgi:hypothetical protein